MTIDSYVGGSVLIFFAVALSIIGLHIVRRFVPSEQFKDAHEVGGYLFAVVGMLYAVLLGLIVVDAIQKFQTARDTTEREANALADMFIMSGQLPAPKRQEVQRLCAAYTDEVSTNEWPAMAKGEYWPEARRMAVHLYQVVLDYQPTTETQKAIYTQMITSVGEFWNHRRHRINIATNGMPIVEWVTLIVGAIVTVAFSYFFGLENLKLQTIMTAMMALLISLNLFLVVLFGYPFSGDLCVHSYSFKVDKGIFDNRVVAEPGSSY